METKQDTAIVLKTVIFEERHRMVSALTAEHGRISAVARNSIHSRRFGGTLDAFSASEWTWVEKANADVARLDHAEIKRSFEGIRRSFEKLALASAISEVILRVAPEKEPCPELFRLHSNALAVIEEAPETDPRLPPDLKLLNFYLGKVLQWSGNQPQILACMNCERSLEDMPLEVDMTWLIPEAAWICHVCRVQESAHVQGRGTTAFQHSLLRVAPAAVRDLRQALETPLRRALEIARANGSEHRGLFALLEALLTYHIPGFDQAPLKSLRFLRAPTQLTV